MPDWKVIAITGWAVALLLLVCLGMLHRQVEQIAQKAIEEHKREGWGEMDTDGE